jgi:hypothetical protein
MLGCEMESFISGCCPAARSCKYDNEPSGCIKQESGQLSDYQLLDKDSAPESQ